MTEREQFEAWCKSKGAPKENWWVRQLDDGGYSCEPVDKAWEAWQARAQTAQAGPVYQDLKAMANAVWAQAEHEKAPEAFATGAAGLTEQSSVLARQPTIAQAVPLLSDSDLRWMWAKHAGNVGGTLDYGREIEQAVRAKLGVAVPMTREQVKSMMDDNGYTNASPQERADFINGIRHAERHHGIVGKEGA